MRSERTWGVDRGEQVPEGGARPLDDVVARSGVGAGRRGRLAAERRAEHGGTADHVAEHVAHAEPGARGRGIELVGADAAGNLAEQAADLVELVAWSHGAGLRGRWGSVGGIAEVRHGELGRFAVAAVDEQVLHLVLPRRAGRGAGGAR